MNFVKFILLLCVFLTIVSSAPVFKAPRTKQAKIISDNLRSYLSRIYTALENSTDFLNHVTALDSNDSRIDVSLISKDVMQKLEEIKSETKDSILKFHRMKADLDPNSHLPYLPKDLVDILDVGHQTKFTEDDFQKILSVIRERQDAVNREEILLLKELEVGEILQRWESHLNDSEEQRNKAVHDFEEARKALPKPSDLHEPLSRAQEKEEWVKADHLPDESFDPKSFFLLHDVNSDGFWDDDEVKGMLSVQIGKLHSDSPLKRQDYIHDMNQRVFEKVDTNKDGLISMEEHMNHMNSADALDDEGWEPEDDELDDVGVVWDEKDFVKLDDRIKQFEHADPESELVKDMRHRLDRMKEHGAGLKLQH